MDFSLRPWLVPLCLNEDTAWQSTERLQCGIVFSVAYSIARNKNKKILVVDGEPHTISSIARGARDEFPSPDCSYWPASNRSAERRHFRDRYFKRLFAHTTGLQLLSYVFGHHPNAAGCCSRPTHLYCHRRFGVRRIAETCEPRRLATIIRDTIYWAKLHRSDASAACQSRN